LLVLVILGRLFDFLFHDTELFHAFLLTLVLEDVLSLKARQALIVFEPFASFWTDDCLGTGEKLVALPAGLFGTEIGLTSVCLDSTFGKGRWLRQTVQVKFTVV